MLYITQKDENGCKYMTHAINSNHDVLSIEYSTNGVTFVPVLNVGFLLQRSRIFYYGFDSKLLRKFDDESYIMTVYDIRETTFSVNVHCNENGVIKLIQ